MNFALVSSLLFASMATAQIASIQMKPTVAPANGSSVSKHKLSSAGPPLLGFISGPDPLEIRPITGRMNSAQLGQPISLPVEARRAFLPARQSFALLETTSDSPLLIYPIRSAAESPDILPAVEISGSFPHPDLVAFSPRGVSCVLYSQSSGILQLILNLPAQPKLEREFSLQSYGLPAKIALSDDGMLIVAAFADGRLVESIGGRPWQLLPPYLKIDAWSFLPGGHSLAFSDKTSGVVSLVSDASELASAPLRVLLESVAVDNISPAKDGEYIVAADSASAQVWTINVRTGETNRHQTADPIGSLLPLRDGYSFLISVAPRISILRLDTSVQEAAQ